MKTNMLSIGLIFFTFGNLANAFADPGATVSKLMDTPVSLFSYGLDKIDDRLDGWAKSQIFIIDGVVGASYGYGGASFDWDTSKITAYIGRNTKPEADLGLLEEECKNTIQALRSMSGLNSEGKISSGGVSYLSNDFFPTGYSLKKFSSDDGKTIDAMITLKVMILNYSKSTRLVCTAPLLGTGYSVEK
jgi:hypothetical protein